jgi:hypothetical protein
MLIAVPSGAVLGIIYAAKRRRAFPNSALGSRPLMAMIGASVGLFGAAALPALDLLPEPPQRQAALSHVIGIHSQRQFDDLLRSTRGPLLLVFYRGGASPDHRTLSALDRFAAKHGEVTVCSVDGENMRSFAESHRATTLPTLMIFRNGRTTERVTGYHSLGELEKLMAGA